jgi:hypothetical protein
VRWNNANGEAIPVTPGVVLVRRMGMFDRLLELVEEMEVAAEESQDAMGLYNCLNEAASKLRGIVEGVEGGTLPERGFTLTIHITADSRQALKIALWDAEAEVIAGIVGEHKKDGDRSNYVMQVIEKEDVSTRGTI